MAESFIVRPNASPTVGAWVAVGAPTLWEAVDEEVANDDTDYAQAATITSMELALPPVDPETQKILGGVVVRARIMSVRGATAIAYPGLQMSIRHIGGLQVASLFVLRVPPQWTAIALTLTAAQIQGITNYSILGVRFTPVAPMTAGNLVRVTQVEVEFPDVERRRQAAPGWAGKVAAVGV